MLVLLHARYPGSSLKTAIDVFMSPKTPPRSGASKEIASFVYGDSEGYHSLFILDADDAKFGEFMKAQTERNVYMESRVPGMTITVVPGHAVRDAIALASNHLA